MPRPWLWKPLVLGLAADAQFTAGADQSQVSKAEAAVGVAFPEDLRDLLVESNGVVADLGVDVIMSCADIETENRDLRDTVDYRELYMPFDNLLFFARDGGGDLFGFGISGRGAIVKDDIYRWDHETDGRAWFASDLRQYLEFRLSPSFYDR